MPFTFAARRISWLYTTILPSQCKPASPAPVCGAPPQIAMNKTATAKANQPQLGNRICSRRVKAGSAEKTVATFSISKDEKVRKLRHPAHRSRCNRRAARVFTWYETLPVHASRGNLAYGFVAVGRGQK